MEVADSFEGEVIVALQPFRSFGSTPVESNGAPRSARASGSLHRPSQQDLRNNAAGFLSASARPRSNRLLARKTTVCPWPLSYAAMGVFQLSSAQSYVGD